MEWEHEIAPLISKEMGEEFSPEYRLYDDSRVDLLSKSYAIEIDYSGKWAECLGQSSFYAIMTRRTPVCLLLVADVDKEQKFIYRCQIVCAAKGIQLWLFNTTKREFDVMGKVVKF